MTNIELLVDDILEYQKEATKNNYREYIVKCDLKKMIQDYVDECTDNLRDRIIEYISDSSTVEEAISNVESCC